MQITLYMHNFTNLFIFPTKKSFEGHIFVESDIVALSAAQGNQMYQFQINFFV